MSAPESAPDMAIRELLEYLVRGVVDEPEEVSVEQFDQDDGSVLLELAVAEQDYGMIIGRRGRTVQALRTVVKAAAARDHRRVFIDLVD